MEGDGRDCCGSGWYGLPVGLILIHQTRRYLYKRLLDLAESVEGGKIGEAFVGCGVVCGEPAWGVGLRPMQVAWGEFKYVCAVTFDHCRHVWCPSFC